MDLPLSIALLMKHPVPYVVLKPMIAALPVIWSEVPTVRLVDALLEGSREINGLPDDKDRLALDVLPRLDWTPELADATLEKAWQVTMGGTPHFVMSAAITTAVAPFASPSGRTLALNRALRRSGPPPRIRAERTPPLVEALLAHGCATDNMAHSPYLNVPSAAMFAQLQAHGFSLQGMVGDTPLVERVRDRAPDSFESPSDRQKILAALPTPDLPVADKILYLLGKAQRWTDVRNALKDVGPDWVNVRFPDGDSVVSKVAARDPEWAIKLFALPAMKAAPLDIAVDGQGAHLVWSLVHNADLMAQAAHLDHPAWKHWASFHQENPASALTAILNETHRYVTRHAVNVPSNKLATMAVARYWPEPAVLKPLFEQLGTTLATARDQALTDPAFQAAMDRTVWNWPSPEHAYYAVENLIQPLLPKEDSLNPSVASKTPFALNLPAGLSTPDTVWIATHLLGSEMRHLGLASDARFMKTFLGLIDEGADWQRLDDLVQEDRLMLKKPLGDTVWYQDLHQRWEARQLREGLATLDEAALSPATPRRRL